MCTICIWTCEVRGGLVQLEHHRYTNVVNAKSNMIKSIEHMYAIDQSKLHESKTFSSLRNPQKNFSSNSLVKISASWFSVLI
jgi:DNA mismatch repair ATPase MutL